MIDVFWNIISCLGLIVLVLVLLGTCILLVCGIISIVKQAKEERLF